jgi:hypothetical protein
MQSQRGLTLYYFLPAQEINRDKKNHLSSRKIFNSLFSGRFKGSRRRQIVVVDDNISLLDGVVNTGDKHKVANISANFRKKSKWPGGN